MPQDPALSPLYSAFVAAVQCANGYPPAQLAARLELLKGLAAAGVTVEAKDFAEYCRRVEQQAEGRVLA